MKKYWFLILFASVSTTLVFGQDAAAQQQIDKLSGQIQDVLAAQGKQDQAIAELRKDFSELRDKVNTPAVNDSASRDDLKTLTTKVQEIDKKRQDDRDLILKEIEKLGKVAAAAPVKTKPAPKAPATDDTTAAPATPQKGYEYMVKAGDTVGLIAKAYREQGVKVTSTQILKANPGLDATKLYVGKKIFIPDPNAK